MTNETVIPRTATSVVLLQERAGRLRTWVIQRVPEMTFAAGMTVFPGGKVEPADSDVPVADAELERLSAALDLPTDAAAALAVAALRETFEETGVLLTEAPAKAEQRARRASLEQDIDAFGAVLRDAGLTLDTPRLLPWARWITPAGAPRRFDTWFFVVMLADEHFPQDVSTEATVAQWADVDDLLTEFRAQLRPMLPPTAAILSELQRLGSLNAVLEAAGSRDLTPVEPVIVKGTDGNPTIRLPDHIVL